MKAISIALRVIFATVFISVAAIGAFAQKIETGFLNRTVVVNNVGYRYQVYVPWGFSRNKTWPVIVGC